MRVKDIKSFQKSLVMLEEEKGIKREEIVEMLNEAVSNAYKKHKETNQFIEVDLADDGSMTICVVKKVVEEVEDKDLEISLADAQKINKDSEIGDEILLEEEECSDFRRNAVQHAKQYVIQKIREAERNKIYNKFESKIGKIVAARVKRVDDKENVYLMVEEIETILPPFEQSSLDIYKPDTKMKVVVQSITMESSSPKVVVSRKDTNLIKELFRFEVPEIENGVVEIKAVAREVGGRTKIAVISNNPSVDGAGTCIGQKGSRIGAVSNELNGERVDVVGWSSDLETYLLNALKPAIIEETIFSTNEKGKMQATLKVKEENLSLAIGKRGQNIRLASKLVRMPLSIEKCE